MFDMIDGSMLLGIAALITSIANSIVVLRTRDRSSSAETDRFVASRRKRTRTSNFRGDVGRTS